jgi:hypothetical protein
MRLIKVLGCLSLLVVASHAAWKWGGACGTSYPGTTGSLGPIFFAALLLWPCWVIACVSVPVILFRQKSQRCKVVALLFAPILIYGIYFLIAGGSGERAGIR